MNGLSNNDERPIIDRQFHGDEKPIIDRNAAAAHNGDASAPAASSGNGTASRAKGSGKSIPPQNNVAAGLGNKASGGKKTHFSKPLAAIAAALILLLILFLVRDTSVSDFKKCLNQGDYFSAITIYNSSIAADERDQEKVRPYIEKAIISIQDEFANGSMSCDSAVSALSAFAGIRDPYTAESADAARMDVTNVHNGNSRRESGHYADAIGLYLQVSREKKLYTVACDHIDICMEKLLEETAGSTGESALQELLAAVSLLNEHQAFSGYVRDAEASVVSLTQTNAERLAQKDEYTKALSLVRNSMAVFPDNGELEALFADCQRRYEQYISSRINALIDAKNFDAAISLLAQVSKENADSDAIRKIQDLVAREQDAYEKQISSQVSSYIAKKDYPAALSLLTKVRKTDTTNTTYQDLEKKVMKEYENHVTNQVQTLIGSDNYASALQLLAQMLKEYPDNACFRKLVTTVEEAQEVYLKKMSEYTNQEVDFVRYDDSISSNDETDVYTLETTIAGHYHFYVTNMVSGFEVNIRVYDNEDGSCVESSTYGLGNNQGITARLDSNKSYTVKVREYSGKGNYQLVIGQPKPTVDISQCSRVYDSIQYTDQRNWYQFTPAVTGYYRFDVTNMVNGFEVNMSIYDELDYTVESSTYGLSINQGLTAYLEAEKTYKIVIRHYQSADTYELVIGKQTPTGTLRENVALSDEITFTDQRNYYTFVATKSGTYVVSLGSMRNSVEMNVSVIDSLGYSVGSTTYGLSSGGTLSVNLKAGEVYTVVVKQYNRSGTYTVKIGYKSS